jgi:hypothetical protein
MDGISFYAAMNNFAQLNMFQGENVHPVFWVFGKIMEVI